MRALFVRNARLQGLLDPDAMLWRSLPPEVIALSGAPSALQPTAAVRAAFPEGSIGAIKAVTVAVAHNGSDIAFRLQWQDALADTGAEGQDDTGFPDAAAILFPTAPKAPLMSMGAPGLPVNAWYWRADEPDRGRQVSAEGLGSSETVDRDLVKVQGAHRNGEWHVVIARAMQATASRPVAQLGGGGRIGVSFAIWEGSRGERAGIKAFALGPHEGWHELVLDAIA